jgi:pimeloyl-ACP methyl ester carboxylesterase
VLWQHEGVTELPVVVLIHGGLWEDRADSDWFWRRTGVVAALERRGCAVVAPDRARRAVSWQREAGYLVGRLHSVLPAGSTAVTVLGASFGCAAAVRLALDFQPVAERLVLAWPASVSDQFSAVRMRADLARLGAKPQDIDALLSGGTLPGTGDEELAMLTMPVGVLRAVPPDPLHPAAAADALLRLLPTAVELPGCPEAPTPEFPAQLEAFADAVAGFACALGPMPSRN